MLKPVKDIVKGDEFGMAWTAIEDARVNDEGHVEVPIRWIGGGRDLRVWDDPDYLLGLTHHGD